MARAEMSTGVLARNTELVVCAVTMNVPNVACTTVLLETSRLAASMTCASIRAL